MKLTWYMKRTVFITYVKRGGDCKGSSRKRWIVKKNKLLWSREKLEQNSMDILRLLYSSHRNYYGQNMLPLSSDQIGSLSSFPVTFLSSA